MTHTATMSRGGFGKGRPSEFGTAMIGKQVVLPPEWWDTLAERAEAEKVRQEKKTGRKRKTAPSASEILRDIIEPVMAGGHITAFIQLDGYVWDRETQSVKPFSQKGRAPAIEIPFIEAVESEEYYALAVIGDALMNMDGEGNSIPDGFYLVMKRENRGFDGALVHVEWEHGGKSHSALRRFKPRMDGSASLVPLNKKQKPVTVEAGNFKVVGIVSRSWDGTSEQ